MRTDKGGLRALIKKPLTMILILVVVLGVVAVGVQLKRRSDVAQIEADTEEAVDRQVDMLKKQNPEAFEGASGEAAEVKYRAKIEEQVRVNEVLKQKAEEVGQKATESEVNAAIAQVKAAYGSEAEFNKALKSRGMTLADYQVSIENQITTSKMMADITKGVQVSDKEARAYYDANPGRYKDPKDASKTRPFKKVVGEIKTLLTSQKQTQAYNDFIADLKK